ncbi:Hap43p-induced protein [Candida albicans SC5314]|nr:Hap43p-induced protein [Candida albicans SC5314]
MSENTSQELKDELSSIQKNSINYSILTSDQDFHNANIKLNNPKLIKDELLHYQNIFSKLKFLYLEQETRDIFLREISEINYKLPPKESNFINEIEFESFNQETQISKQRLKKNKQKMYNKISQLELITNDTDLLYTNYSNRSRQIQQLLNDEINSLELKINDELMMQNDNQTIMEYMMDSRPSSSVSEMISLSQNNENHNHNHNNQDQVNDNDILKKNAIDKLHEINNDINEITKQYENNLYQIEIITKKLNDLNDILKNLKPREYKDDKLQKYTKWSTEMNEILTKLSIINKVELNKEAGTTSGNEYRLSISYGDSGTNNLIIKYHEGDWKIVSLQGYKDNNNNNKLISKINSLGNQNDFFKAIAQFIVELTK